jgi:hypothetical protein
MDNRSAHRTGKASGTHFKKNFDGGTRRFSPGGLNLGNSAIELRLPLRVLNADFTFTALGHAARHCAIAIT